MTVRWCYTHDAGWFQHERDETCRYVIDSSEKGKTAWTAQPE